MLFCKEEIRQGGCSMKQIKFICFFLLTVLLFGCGVGVGIGLPIAPHVSVGVSAEKIISGKKSDSKEKKSPDQLQDAKESPIAGKPPRKK
jgi:hypothetical protein